MGSAHLNKNTAVTRKRKLVKFAGYFEPNGASNPAVVNIPGVKSVTYAATGKYTLTLDDTWTDVAVTGLTLQLHTIADVQVLASDVNPTAAGGATVLILAVLTSTGASGVAIANVAGKAGNRIHVELTCSGGTDFSKQS